MKTGKGKNKESSKLNKRENEAYELRYIHLKKQCEKLEQRNERLLHRLHSVGSILKQYKKEKAFLMQRLDQHGDNYREAPAALPYENQEGNKAILNAMKQLVSTKRPKSGTETQTPSRKKAKMELKDPNAPKKPVNAYVMFFQHHRHSVQETYFKDHKTEIGNHELTRIVGQQWNKLSTEEKQVFYNLYEKDKERYQKELTKYESSKDGEVKDSETPDLAKESPSKKGVV
ncbi:uncharacterized protein [Watersipora subatra]|uniref:uncharacterized protein n=1 Tax=Watersipora subatra TaxID=2589382 RepID=UPI00355B2B02